MTEQSEPHARTGAPPWTPSRSAPQAGGRRATPGHEPPLDRLLAQLAAESVRRELTAIGAPVPERVRCEFTAEIARALHLVIAPAARAGERDALVMAIRKAERMVGWLEERATADPTADAARDLAAAVLAVLHTHPAAAPRSA